MFDLVGSATTDGALLSFSPSLDTAFTREPWAGLNGIVRLNVGSPDCHAAGLRRYGDLEDFAEASACRVFVVGDVFSRIASPRRWRGRIPAGVLLQLYRERGTSFVDAVKGNFTILILDTPQRTLHILTSHFAVSPFYYAQIGRTVCFSTCLTEIVRLLPKQPSLDRAALAETVLFNWPMQGRTFLEKVKRITAGTVLSISGDGISRRTYWDQRALYSGTPLEESEALEQGSALFHECANAMVSDRDEICASFTAGFDSRALHAVLDKDHSRILSYAFGRSGSVNIAVAEAICSRLGFPFRPFYLDQHFVDVFETYARRTVALSDGFVLQRANYPYVFERLSGFAPVVVTGIFGSEFLRTFQNVGEFVSENFVRLNTAADPISEYRLLVQEQRAASYLSPEVYGRSEKDVEADIASWFEWSRGFDANERLHMYLLGEASRGYFGAEISTERVYATNLFPFLDVDFVEYIVRAPFGGVHTRALKPSVADRFKSQYFYAYLIRKYRPELLRDTTDHGYPPGDLLKSPSLLYTGPKFVWSKLRGRATGFREFEPDKWLSRFYADQRFTSQARNRPDLIAGAFADDLESGAWRTKMSAFGKIAALQVWMEEWS